MADRGGAVGDTAYQPHLPCRPYELLGFPYQPVDAGFQLGDFRRHRRRLPDLGQAAAA